MATSTPESPATTTTSYDLAPYPSASFPQSHPLRLATIGRMFGLEAKAPSSARVLELGCTDGANLLPMADLMPGASFLGIDASKVQIDAGLKALAVSGLKNIELRHQDILEFPATEGKFDYIIVHGIFSWVPEPVREKIMQICSQHLTENGIAYISYNTLPGWGMRRSLRDMMLFHTHQITDGATKVKQARALLNFLSEYVPTENNAYGMLLKAESEFMNKQVDSYLRRDILADENTAFYFHEFVGRAGKHGLQYVGESGLSQMLATNFPEKVRDTLTRIQVGVVAQEQYMDFLRNRVGRQTLICHASRKLNRQIQPAAMVKFAFQSLFKQPEAPVDLTNGVSAGFVSTAGPTVNASDSFVKAALQALIAAAPAPLAYAELLRLARQASRPFLGAVPANRDEIDESTLQVNLLNLYSQSFLEIYDEAVSVAKTVPAKPALSPLVRYHAIHSRHVANRLHQAVQSDDFARFVIEACDGNRTRDEILTAVIGRVNEGKLSVKEGDQPVTAEKKLRTLLGPQVDTVLEKLVIGGFFAP